MDGMSTKTLPPIVPVSYTKGEYRVNLNKFRPKEYLPTKLNGFYFEPDQTMSFRPELEYLTEIAIGEDEVFGCHYSEVLGVLCVASKTKLIVIDDITGEIKLQTTITASYQITFLDVNVSGRLATNVLTDKNPNWILISGTGSLKYISKTTAGVFSLLNFMIHHPNATSAVTPPVRDCTISHNRLFIISENLLTTTTAGDRTHIFASFIGVYDNFVTTSSDVDNKSFEIQTRDEEHYKMLSDRKQIVVSVRNGLLILATVDSGMSFASSNVEAFRIDYARSLMIRPVIFANFAVYAAEDGLRVRAFSQISAIYSPQIEPGCVPINTDADFHTKNLKSIQVTYSPENLVVLEDGKVYHYGYPSPIAFDLAVRSKYPRTTYFESEDLSVIGISNSKVHLVLRDNKTRKVFTVKENKATGQVLMVGSKSTPPVFSTTGGTTFTLSNWTLDMVYAYVNVSGVWHLIHRVSAGKYKTADNTNLVAGTYQYFPAQTEMMLEHFGLGEGGSISFKVDNAFYSTSGQTFILPIELTNILNLNSIKVYKYNVCAVMELYSDALPNNPSYLTRAVFLISGDVAGNLLFTPKSDLANTNTENNLVTVPLSFTTANVKVRITINPVLNDGTLEKPRVIALLGS